MFELPALIYPYNALEPHIDETTMKIHHDLHHGAYVKNLNDALANFTDWMGKSIEEIMRDIDKVPSDVKTKVRNNGGGHYNHSLYWKIMTPKGGGEPPDEMAEVINKSFGSFASFRDQFSKAAINRFGSGWAWVVKTGEKLAIIDSPNQDNPLMEGKTPIMGIDVWEHAYYLKYQNKRIDYITSWWNVVNWPEILDNYQKAE